MSENCFMKFKQFSNDDLIAFMVQNNWGEYSQVLRNENVDGKTFLELTELDLRKWKLTAVERKKLMSSVINEINTNPQKYVKSGPTEVRKIKSPISKEKLELVKSVLKPNLMPKPGSLDALPKDVEDHYDEENYLRPTCSFLLDKRPIRSRGNSYMEIFEGSTKKRDSEEKIPPVLPPRNPRNAEEKELQTFQRGFLRLSNRENSFWQRSSRPPADRRRTNSEHLIYSDPDDNNYGESLKRDEMAVMFTAGVENNEREFSSLSKLDDGYHSSEYSGDFATKSLNRLDPRVRPLPPLPPSENKISLPPKRTVKGSGSDDALSKMAETLETTQKMRQNSREDSNDSLYANSASSGYYGNINEEMQRLPNSYEKFALKNTPLPTPPSSVPDLSILMLDEGESAESDENDGGDYTPFHMNLNDEPFFRNTDRKGARQLLHDLPNGAFLFRRSQNAEFSLVLSVKCMGKVFNVGIEINSRGKLKINSVEESSSPEFADMTDLIDYFSTRPLTVKHEGNVAEVYLLKVLRPNRF